jgi:hypothetical protein
MQQLVTIIVNRLIGEFVVGYAAVFTQLAGCLQCLYGIATGCAV